MPFKPDSSNIFFFFHIVWYSSTTPLYISLDTSLFITSCDIVQPLCCIKHWIFSVFFFTSYDIVQPLWYWIFSLVLQVILLVRKIVTVTALANATITQTETWIIHAYGCQMGKNLTKRVTQSVTSKSPRKSCYFTRRSV